MLVSVHCRQPATVVCIVMFHVAHRQSQNASTQSVAVAVAHCLKVLQLLIYLTVQVS